MLNAAGDNLLCLGDHCLGFLTLFFKVVFFVILQYFGLDCVDRLFDKIVKFFGNSLSIKILCDSKSCIHCYSS